MRVVFIGSVLFSYMALEKLLAMQVNIVGVCTKKSNAFNSDYKDLTPLCEKHHLPYQLVDDINGRQNLLWIKNLRPDIIFCFGWSSLLKPDLLNLSPMGVVGYHPAKLPQNRGRHPIIWSLALGLKHSASTFFFIQNGVDNGDIISQHPFEIKYDDDATSLYKKIAHLALSQIEQFVPLLQSQTLQVQAQDHTKANYWRKRDQKDGLIDFRMTTRAIYNLVRALTKPYVGAHVLHYGEPISLWKVEEVEDFRDNIEPGKVLDVKNNEILVKTYDGAIRILQHDFTDLPQIGAYL